MNLTLRIAGHEYLPLRALPFVSNNLLSPERVIRMIWDYERHYHPDYENVLSPYKWSASSSLSPVPHKAFRCIDCDAETGGSPDPRPLPPAMVVQTAAARAMHSFMVEVIMPLPGRGFSPGQAVWNPSPQLKPDERRFVLEGLPQPRANSIGLLLPEVRSAFTRIKAHCLSKGIDLDEGELPGDSLDWEILLRDFVPAMQPRSEDIWKDHMKSIGLRWRQGRQNEAWEAVVCALEDLPRG